MADVEATAARVEATAHRVDQFFDRLAEEERRRVEDDRRNQHQIDSAKRLDTNSIRRGAVAVRRESARAQRRRRPFGLSLRPDETGQAQARQGR